MNETFEGCLRKFKLHSKDVAHHTGEFGVSKCSEKVEKGVFFYGGGGAIRLSSLFYFFN